MIFGSLVLLALLCYLIGRAADVVIVSTKAIGRSLGVKDFWLGIALGALTSTPELFIGIQSQVRGNGELSFGNLTGGVLVLLGLVLGLSVALQREVRVAKVFVIGELAAIAGYIVLPLVLASDGVLSPLDGLLLVALYLTTVFFLMERHRRHGGVALRRRSSNLASSLKLVAGLAIVLVLARLILEVTLALTAAAGFSLFIIGLLLLAVGTNLPEITLAFSAYRSHARELSLGNLVGSSFANGCVLGILALLGPITFERTSSFFVLVVATVVLLVSFIWYAASGKTLTRREGWALVATYVAFVAVSLAVR